MIYDERQEMTGTMINTAAIVAGGVFGHFCGRLLKKRHQETLTAACGIGTIMCMF